MRRPLALITVAAIAVAACSDDSPTGRESSVSVTASTSAPTTTAAGGSTTTVQPAAEPTEADEATVAAVQAAVDSGGQGCDPLDTKRCLLPFPSDAYRVDGPLELRAVLGTLVDAAARRADLVAG